MTRKKRHWFLPATILYKRRRPPPHQAPIPSSCYPSPYLNSPPRSRNCFQTNPLALLASLTGCYKLVTLNFSPSSYYFLMVYGNPMCNLPTGNRFLTLLARWPESAKVLRKMSNGVENLIKNWDDFNAEFKESVTLRDKTMLIPMIYLPWDLCDDTYWSGTRLTQWLGPTPRRYDVKTTWTRCVYMYVFVFVYCYLHIY